MSELSIFIDESGDFGEYDYHSPYYIISMVYHDQANSIEEPLQALSRQLSNIGYPDHCVHTEPIIRRENEYEYEKIMTRRKIFNYMITFIKRSILFSVVTHSGVASYHKITSIHSLAHQISILHAFQKTLQS